MNAADHLAAREASFDRSDTDGFLTQAAHGALAAQAHLQEQIDAQGGRLPSPALFDLDGNMVHAKQVDSRFGTSWGIWDNPQLRGRCIKFVTESQAGTAVARAKALAKKGYTVGIVLAPRQAEMGATWSPYAKRTDGGYDATNEVVSATGWDAKD